MRANQVAYRLVGLCVCRSVCPESVLWQMADRIRMPFLVVSGVGRGTGLLDGVVIVEREGAVLRVNLGRPMVTNGDFLRSCALSSYHV